MGRASETVVRIVRVNRLRIEGFVSAAQAGRIRIGAPVRVKFSQDWLKNRNFTGSVVFVSPEANPVNSEILVWAEISNEHNDLLPGLRGEIEISANDTPLRRKKITNTEFRMKIRLRHDLEFVKRAMKFDDDWVVKDPISFNHFLFTDPEYQLLKLFDGNRSENEIQLAWREKFSTKSLTVEQIRQFANRLIRDKLVSVDELGYGSSLYQDELSAKKLRWQSLVLSPLVIRFRGVNPRFILDGLSWFGWILFHPAIVVAMMSAALLVLAYLLGHFDELAYRLPAISQLLSAQGIIGIVVTISVVKILHELGHAMACQRCGGECFEIGVILLAFRPTLYCNVSSAWTFPECWKRLLVSFGGVYIEIILAAIASIIWLLTEPGLLNAMMFNVVFLCSVNTVLLQRQSTPAIRRILFAV